MTSPSLQIWFRADVVFKHLKTAATVTYSFTNRTPIAETSAIYFPILETISGCGLTVGQDGMPAISSGSITLKDPFESAGEETRIFDLFQDYTPIEQIVTLYDASTDITDTSPTSDFAICWKGICKSVSKSFDGEDQVLVFNVESFGIPETVVTTRLDESNLYDSDNPSPEMAGYGKTLPCLWGDETLEVPGVQFRNDSIAGYAIGAGAYWDFFGYNDYNYILAKDDQGRYRSNYFGHSLTGEGYLGGHSFTTPGANPMLGSNELEEAYFLPPLFSTIDIAAALRVTGQVCGGRWYFYGQNNGSINPNGQIIFSLYESSESDPFVPTKKVSECVIEKSDYLTQIRGASVFTVDFAFNNIQANKTSTNGVRGYILSKRLSEFDSIATDFVNVASVASPATPTWVKTANGEWGTEFTAPNPMFSFYLVACKRWYKKVGTKYITTGEISGRAYGGTTTPTLDYHQDLVFYTTGISDSDLGYITKPADVVKTLATYSSSSAIMAATWDFDCFSTVNNAINSTSHQFYRKVNGYLTGEQTLKSHLAEICKQTGSFIVQRLNGRFAFWPWGEKSSVVKVYSDEDILSWGGFSRIDASSVINKVSLYGKKTFSFLNLQNGAATNEFQNYSLSYILNKDSSSYGSFLCSTSQSIYGDRELEVQTCDLLGDLKSMASLAEFYLRTHDHPHQTVTFDVDYFENRTIELLDVIELLSAFMPSTGGTTMSAREASYDSEYTTPHQGYYSTRAQRYRCQIVGREINWSKGSIPRLTLEARVLSPYHPNDPT